MFDLTLQIVLFRLAGLLAIAGVHGAALAGSARLLGDPGPAYDGRLTLNPLPHLDFVGGIGLAFFRLGWVKPVAIDPAMLKAGRAGLALAALAGLAAVLLLAIALRAARQPLLMASTGNLALGGVALLDIAADLCRWFVIFNLIPVPPLTGGLFLQAVAPRATALLARYRAGVIAALAAFVASGWAFRVLHPGNDLLAALFG
ncbi:site-2 protease family protein [Propylenella binzhouense]|uniref:Site-2 protease family protein n=1 Tax=Propylenella binzhouense TaxID=2555902 RepID=A0A964WS51_9HYPH|nr:site-2 protease family protein [Propylenella binzhouense]MYZ46475.1 site-2 protease family protein [Propylenella binzhouense]